jgi:hypothetical protein
MRPSMMLPCACVYSKTYEIDKGNAPELKAAVYTRGNAENSLIPELHVHVPVQVSVPVHVHVPMPVHVPVRNLPRDTLTPTVSSASRESCTYSTCFCRKRTACVCVCMYVCVCARTMNSNSVLSIEGVLHLFNVFLSKTNCVCVCVCVCTYVCMCVCEDYEFQQ